MTDKVHPKTRFHQHAVGEKSSAICCDCGLVSTTFAVRDVPFEDGIGVAEGIMTCVCDGCGIVVAIPALSTPQIASARRAALAASCSSPDRS